MKKLLLILLLSISFCGSPWEHTIWSFQDLRKPTKDIDFIDHVNATIKHGFVDGAVAENGTNLIFYNAGFTLLSYYKAKSIGMEKQYRMAATDGNLFDIADKTLTGGAIQYQIQQIPIIGDSLSLMVPHIMSHELIHSIPGYPKPSYSMTEGQYFWFQVTELGLFWLECDFIKSEQNKIYAEIKI